MLKMKNSREFFSQVSKKFGSMPFTLRNMENETKAKMGVVECVTHKLIDPFQVLYEKEGDNVCLFISFAVTFVNRKLMFSCTVNFVQRTDVPLLSQ